MLLTCLPSSRQAILQVSNSKGSKVTKQLPSESSSNTKPPQSPKISAKKLLSPPSRVCQGDIFTDLEVIENFLAEKSVVTLQKIQFPFSVCLNQECDLLNDFNGPEDKDARLLHLAFAPAFIFEQFLKGSHWGGIFSSNLPQKRTNTTVRKIIDNEIPRYHYLKFPDPGLPELILDFKHFFTINRNEIYTKISHRLCSLDDLFREKINQRFSYYLSRIGLPDE